jgi:protein-tyrosine phosphatase
MMLNVSRSVGWRYGCRRVLWRHLDAVRYRFGFFARFEKVEWATVERLVFVCKGNVCRSAYCEAKAKNLGLNASSFGLDVGGESPADQTAVRAARARGVDLSVHRTRSAASVGFEDGDLLLVMESAHVDAIKNRSLAEGSQIALLGLWCNPTHPRIEDPYGLPVEHFDSCFDCIDDALTQISTIWGRARTDAA